MLLRSKCLADVSVATKIFINFNRRIPAGCNGKDYGFCSIYNVAGCKYAFGLSCKGVFFYNNAICSAQGQTCFFCQIRALTGCKNNRVCINVMLAAFLFFDDGSAVLIEGKRFHIHKVYAGNRIGSCDTLKSLRRMHEYSFFFCLLNFFIISSHGFSCLQTGQMDFLCAQTFCGSRTVESYVSTSENNDTLAHSGLLTKTCITQEINI